MDTQQVCKDEGTFEESWDAMWYLYSVQCLGIAILDVGKLQAFTISYGMLEMHSSSLPLTKPMRKIRVDEFTRYEHQPPLFNRITANTEHPATFWKDEASMWFISTTGMACLQPCCWKPR